MERPVLLGGFFILTLVGTGVLDQEVVGLPLPSMSARFNDSLPVGKASERDLMDIVRERGKTPVEIEGRFSGYDFFVLETKKAYEVKKDHKSAYTGNVVIEIEHPVGKPSALMVTQADWWVFDLPAGYLFIQPERIKDCLVQNDYRTVEFVGEGDTHKKKAYLVEEKVLRHYGEAWIKR